MWKFTQVYASKVMLPKHIFLENFMKIDQEKAEKIVNQARTNKNNINNNKEEEEEISE